MSKEWNKQTPWCASNLQQPFQLVSTYRCCTQGQQWKTPSHWLQSSEQSHMEIHITMPKVEDIFSKLNSAKYFSTIDLCTGYNHIPLNEDSIRKTAFTSPFGKYQYLKVPFGLAQHQHTSKNSWIKYWKIILCYFLPRWYYYLQQNWRRTLGPSTESFPQTLQCRTTYEIEQVPLLCQGISIFGPCPQHNQYKATTFQSSRYLTDETPKNAKQGTAFLGLVCYYCKFIKNFAHIAKSPNSPYMSSCHHAAFNTLKSAFTEAPILHYQILQNTT